MPESNVDTAKGPDGGIRSVQSDAQPLDSLIIVVAAAEYGGLFLNLPILFSNCVPY